MLVRVGVEADVVEEGVGDFISDFLFDVIEDSRVSQDPHFFLRVIEDQSALVFFLQVEEVGQSDIIEKQFTSSFG